MTEREREGKDKTRKTRRGIIITGSKINCGRGGENDTKGKKKED
jgi:hypothetical protein